MNRKHTYPFISLIAICAIFLLVFTAGCTETTGTSSPGAAPEPAVTAAQQAAVSPASAAAAGGAPVSGSVIAYTAASLSGVSKTLGPAFQKEYPQAPVTFDLDGTQNLKYKVEQGAYADVFISASAKYTKALKDEGYFVNDTVKDLTTNYVIVIIPANNPGNIRSLADLGKPGTKIAMGTAEVPIGIVTRTVLGKLANSTYNASWQENVFANVKSYETAEPGVVTKVSLGEVDAGFVYESSYKAATAGTLNAIEIPKQNNALQLYSIAVLRESTNKPAAQAFEDFMLSPAGQKILLDFGFRPVS